MKKEYVSFVKDPKGIPIGKEISLVIQDLTPGPRKYNCRVVKAIVSDSAEQMPGGDILYLRSGTGILDPQPRGIKIIADKGHSLSGLPYSDVLGGSI